MNQKFNRIRQILVAFVLIAAIKDFLHVKVIHLLRLLLIRIRPGICQQIFSQFLMPIVSAATVVQNHLTSGKESLIAALTKGGYVNLPGETSRLYLKMTVLIISQDQLTLKNRKFSTG